MKKDSGIYIIGFCVVVCLVCAVFVSSAAVGLKPLQEENQRLDKQKNVLSVAGLLPEGSVSKAQVEELFKKRIKPVVVSLKDHGVAEDIDPLTFDQQKAKSDPDQSTAAPKNPAGVQRIPNHALLYFVSSKDMAEDGSGFELEQYIFPVEGKGLWSTLYGYLALAPDGNEIRGLTFYQHGETPGLGGEVDNPVWQRKWLHRLAYYDPSEDDAVADYGKPQIQVIKGQAGPPSKDPFDVDGLSGATITSKGVSNLLQFWLGSNGFGPFIKEIAAKAS